MSQLEQRSKLAFENKLKSLYEQLKRNQYSFVYQSPLDLLEDKWQKLDFSSKILYPAFKSRISNDAYRYSLLSNRFEELLSNRINKQKEKFSVFKSKT